MNDNEQEMLDRELEEYVDEWATSYRNESVPAELDEQDLKEELQAVRSGIEGYTIGLLRGWRLQKDDGDADRSEELLSRDDHSQLNDLIESKMRTYMKSIPENHDISG